MSCTYSGLGAPVPNLEVCLAECASHGLAGVLMPKSADASARAVRDSAERFFDVVLNHYGAARLLGRLPAWPLPAVGRGGFLFVLSAPFAARLQLLNTAVAVRG